MADIAGRKAQHIQLALEPGSQGKGKLWEEIPLPVKALPELNLQEVDTAVTLLGKKLRQPLIIASMTGGAAQGKEINGNLAGAAEKMGVALGVGSQRAALEKPEMRETFMIVREKAPNTVIFANMGAVQLNYGRKIEDYREVVKMVGADALYLHLNPMQEAMQPEGDTDFSNLVEKVGRLVEEIGVPVFAKEVGSGLDVETAEKLIKLGVAGIDCAGVGGTSWTWIEGKRSGNDRLTEWFADWGITTEVLVPALAKNKGKATLVASGGIRSPIEGLKAHIAGADYYSAARPFLEAAMQSEEETVKLVGDWETGLRLAMFGCGMRRW